MTAKDLVLGIITQIGTGGGQGHIIEYRGEAIRGLSMEGRMTVCNMSIEAGARAGMIAPDETTFDYLQGRPHAPQGADWDAAVALWQTFVTDDGAEFDKVVHVDATALSPWVTWGTNPGPGRAAVRPGAGARRRGRRARARLHGSRARHAVARRRRRHRLHRLLHERSARGPARRRRRACAAARSPTACGFSSYPGRSRSRQNAEAEGLRRGLRGGRRRVARCRMLDVSRR